MIVMGNAVMESSDSLKKEFEVFKQWTKDMFKSMRNDIDSVANYRNPSNTEGRIDQLFEAWDKSITDISNIHAKINALNIDKKFLELFSDKEISDLYTQSNIAIKNVADKFAVTQQQASNYVRGAIEDLTVRNRLARWFKEECEKNKIKITKNSNTKDFNKI